MTDESGLTLFPEGCAVPVLTFSIVIPTRNEANDIEKTLDALVSLQPRAAEILVIDDSTDNTPELVRAYESRGVRLIHPGGGGRCEARNRGIQAATGEVVVILNADVHLPIDFLSRLEPYYAKGADMVLVQSSVANTEALLARYVDTVAKQRYPSLAPLLWTEGFSCRRSLALACGGFPTGHLVPLVAGEDAEFGRQMLAHGARKGTADDILVQHVAPAEFKEFWHIRKGRGRGSAQVHMLLWGWRTPIMLAWNAIKWLRFAVSLGLMVPALRINWHHSQHSALGRRDTIPLTMAWAIDQLAMLVGEHQETWRIFHARRQKSAFKNTPAPAPSALG